MFESIPDGTIGDVLCGMEATIDRCEAKDIDLVIQIGEEEILKYSPEYTAEGINAIIQEGKANEKVKDITICSVIDKEEMEAPGVGYTYTSELNEIIKDLCITHGASFLDLRPVLRACRFNGLNRTEYLYTAEGARAVSRSITHEVQGFFK